MMLPGKIQVVKVLKEQEYIGVGVKGGTIFKIMNEMHEVRVKRLRHQYHASRLSSDLGILHSMPQFSKTEITVSSSFVSTKRNASEDLQNLYSSKKSTCLSQLSSAWFFQIPSLMSSTCMFGTGSAFLFNSCIYRGRDLLRNEWTGQRTK